MADRIMIVVSTKVLMVARTDWQIQENDFSKVVVDLS
jgi:hypothetical protein